MSPRGSVTCRLPVPPLEAAIEIGDRRMTVPERLDTVELRPAGRRLSLVLRAPFRYIVKPAERRVAIVSAVGGVP